MILDGNNGNRDKDFSRGRALHIGNHKKICNQLKRNYKRCLPLTRRLQSPNCPNISLLKKLKHNPSAADSRTRASSGWPYLLASLQYQIAINRFILPKEPTGRISMAGTVTLQSHFSLNTTGLDDTEGHQRTARCLDNLQEIRGVACLYRKAPIQAVGKQNLQLATQSLLKFHLDFLSKPSGHPGKQKSRYDLTKQQKNWNVCYQIPLNNWRSNCLST